jgi:hypothetical protein
MTPYDLVVLRVEFLSDMFTIITEGALGQYSHSSSFLSQTMTQRQEFPDSLKQCIGGHDSIEKYKHYIKPETLEDGSQ